MRNSYRGSMRANWCQRASLRDMRMAKNAEGSMGRLKSASHNFVSATCPTWAMSTRIGYSRRRRTAASSRDCTRAGRSRTWASINVKSSTIFRWHSQIHFTQVSPLTFLTILQIISIKHLKKGAMSYTIKANNNSQSWLLSSNRKLLLRQHLFNLCLRLLTSLKLLRKR
jgi:hypothetical protein